MRPIGTILLLLCLPTAPRAADTVHLWSLSFRATPIGQNPSFVFPIGMAVDRLGNVFIGGAFFGSMNFGADSLRTDDTPDAFVVCFDSLGVHRWSRSFAARISTGSTV
ncbi:MAG: hypothetical protein L0Z51_00805 [Candidatus Latescibacteria bacterium]|nr:hypothetical protein [Candidatus Latescibacterota bacterium]